MGLGMSGDPWLVVGRWVSKSALSSCTHALVRHDAVHKPLQQPYDGPYKTIKYTHKHYTLQISGRHEVVSVDCLKPAHLGTCPLPLCRGCCLRGGFARSFDMAALSGVTKLAGSARDRGIGVKEFTREKECCAIHQFHGGALHVIL